MKPPIQMDEIPLPAAEILVRWSEETGLPAPVVVGLLVRLLLVATMKSKSDPSSILIETALNGGLKQK